MKKSLLVLLISVCAALLSAQSAATKVPYISLEYYDSPSQIQITDLKGFTEQTLYFGMKLDPGYKIKTLKSSAELKLFPNGSIIKLAPNTEIALSSLQGLNEATSTDIDVVGGKIRMVASKLGKPSYKLKTPTAVAGVRGTDFGIEVISGKAEKLLVREGSVEFSKADGSGTSLVNTGMGLDAFASTFAATALSLEELGSFFAELDFSTLNPLEVPASDTAQDVASVDAAKDNAVVVEEKPATLVEETVKPQAVDAVAIPVVEDVKADDSKPQTEKPEDKADAETPAWQKLLAKYLGLELGSITLDGRTYGKAVMQPKFETDSFKLALYLPVIYKDNILDPSDWYRPAGNDEWSFGTDQGGDWLLIAGDAAQDLMLKLKFLQIGSEGSPFFMKVANIPSNSSYSREVSIIGVLVYK